MENQSVLDFLFADYSFINAPLAKLYGYKGDVALDHRHRKVQFSQGNRGGLLGHASILKITANGIDTSPVTRGVWVLENILGTPPPAPPPDVEPLDPDVRGAKNIRDQLKKHRESPTCYDCHQRIDPIGFALENFDPIGAWRGFYEKKGGKIDASGELPDGQTFKNVVGFKKALHSKEKFFVRHLIEKLFSYSLGQHLDARAKFEIDKIVERAESNNYRFMDIMSEIVSHDLFESK